MVADEHLAYAFIAEEFSAWPGRARFDEPVRTQEEALAGVEARVAGGKGERLVNSERRAGVPAVQGVARVEIKRRRMAGLGTTRCHRCEATLAHMSRSRIPRCWSRGHRSKHIYGHPVRWLCLVSRLRPRLVRRRRHEPLLRSRSASRARIGRDYGGPLIRVALAEGE